MEMTARRFLMIGLISILSLTISACGWAAQADAAGQIPENKEPPTTLPLYESTTPFNAPEDVVSSYYDWYLSYCCDVAAQMTRSPLVDGAYHGSDYLTENFKTEVDLLLASFEGYGYDPFLCAQDIPDSITLETVDISGDEATVVAHGSWEGHEMLVLLKLVDREWKIDDVICHVNEGDNL
jgi:hypothetical protein